MLCKSNDFLLHFQLKCLLLSLSCQSQLLCELTILAHFFFLHKRRLFSSALVISRYALSHVIWVRSFHLFSDIFGTSLREFFVQLENLGINISWVNGYLLWLLSCDFSAQTDFLNNRDHSFDLFLLLKLRTVRRVNWIQSLWAFNTREFGTLEPWILVCEIEVIVILSWLNIVFGTVSSLRIRWGWGHDLGNIKWEELPTTSVCNSIPSRNRHYLAESRSSLVLNLFKIQLFNLVFHAFSLYNRIGFRFFYFLNFLFNLQLS